ncbi:MAG: HPr family phosphocarrier protein [Candidatus Krumholzibacteriia bacterium]
MVEFQSLVNNKIGMHLRAAGEFVKLANKFTSEITVIKNGKKANGKSILGLASLAVGAGSTITIRVEGDDEMAAKAAIEDLISHNFYEE